jgi:DNA polymerase V
MARIGFSEGKSRRGSDRQHCNHSVRQAVESGFLFRLPGRGRGARRACASTFLSRLLLLMRTDHSIDGIFAVARTSAVACPLFVCGVSAGFPSPADDHIDRKLDLNELLIQNPAATFFVRVAGDSMRDAGIHHGDILVVDRSLEAANGKIIIGIVNGELTVKRLLRRPGACRLIAENPDYPSLEITEDTDFAVWGVVTSVIHQF